MQANGPDSPCSEIDAFLRGCRRSSEMQASRAYWQTHPCITAAEIQMLASLANSPCCVETIAARLGRDGCGTRELLDALTSVGLLERLGESYAATDATILYCRMVAGSC